MIARFKDIRFWAVIVGLSALLWYFTLTWVLLFIAVCALLALKNAWTENDQRLRQAVFGFPLIVVVALLILVFFHLGLREGSFGRSAKIPDHGRFTLDFKGFYTRADTPFTLAGDGTTRTPPGATFFLTELSPGEEITLSPDINVSGVVTGWNVSGSSCADGPWSRLLRLDGKCINVPNDQWLTSGDVITFTTGRTGSRKFSLTYHHVGGAEWFAYADTAGRKSTISTRYIKEGLNLRGVLSRGLRVGGLSAACRRLLGGDKRRQGEYLGLQRDFVIDNIVLIREEKGRAGSKLGIVLLESMDNFYTPTIEGRGALKSDREVVSVQNVSACELRYGLGSRALSITLPTQREPAMRASSETTGRQSESILKYRFSTPIKYPLPVSTSNGKPTPISEFFVTNYQGSFPFDGLVVPAGGKGHTFCAKCAPKLAPWKSTLCVADSEHGEIESPVNSTVEIGGVLQGVLLAMSHASILPRSAGTWSMLLIIVSSVVLVVALLRKRERSSINARDLVLTMIWAITLALATVRLVVSYRVSLMPPLNIGPIEAREFASSLPIAFWGGMVGLPISLLLVFIVFENKTAINKLHNWAGRVLEWLRRTRSKEACTSRWQVNYHVLSVIAAVVIGTIYVAGAVTGLGVVDLLAMFVQPFAKWLVVGVFIVFMAVSGRWRCPPMLLWFVLLAVLLNTKMQLSIAAYISLLIYLTVITGRPDCNGPKVFYGLGLFLVTVLVTDLGATLLYLISLFPVILSLLLLRTRGKPLGIVTGALTALWCVTVLLGLLRFAPMLMAHRADASTTFLTRCLVLADREVDYLTSATPDNLSADKHTLVLRNAQQKWQMLSYAAAGCVPGLCGYGKAPLSLTGMDYLTGLTDCAFSTYVLAEHGAWGGMMLLTCSCLLAGLMLTIGLAASSSSKTPFAFIVPFMGAGYFGLNSLYSASANLNMVVFTGQNYPMLGLRSLGEMVQSGLVVLVVGICLYRSEDTLLIVLRLKEARNSLRLLRGHRLFHGVNNPGVAVACLVTVMVFAFGWVAVFATLCGLHTTAHKRISDFNYVFGEDSKQYTNVKGYIEQHIQDGSLYVGDDRSIKRTERNISGIEEVHRKLFNSLPDEDKMRPNRSIFYLAQGQNGRLGIAMNVDALTLRSPYNPSSLWQGAVLAQSPTKDDLRLIGMSSPLRIALCSSGGLKSVTPDTTGDVTGCSQLSLFERNPKNGRKARVYAQLLNKNGTLQLFSVPRSGWAVSVNGEQLHSTQSADGHTQTKSIEPGSLMEFKKESPEKDASTQQMSIFYVGKQGPTLTKVCWRNGKRQHVVSSADVQSMPFVTLMANEASAPLIRKGVKYINLSIDVQLQQEMTKAIDRFAAHSRVMMGKKIAVTLMDVHSGEIVAMAARPSAPMPSERQPANYNLSDHVTGSTFKPAILSVAASGFWPDFRIEEVAVTPHNPQYYDRVFGINLEKRYPRKGVLNESRIIDVKTWLTESFNWPAIVFGFMSCTDGFDTLTRAIADANGRRSDFLYKGQPKVMDLTRLGSASPFSEDTASPIKMQESVLARYLPRIMNLGIGNEGAWNRQLCESFIPSFSPKSADDPVNTSVRLMLLPQKTFFVPALMQSPRYDVFNAFIGAGEFARFSNVTMAETGARLALGKAVTATLEKREGAISFPDLPKPISDSDWRKANLIDSMNSALMHGTARSLRHMITSRGYYGIFKSGTVDSTNVAGDWQDETLLFVIGKFRDNKFVPGESIVGYLWLDRSRRAKTEDEYLKYRFARQYALPVVLEYLDGKRLINGQ